MQALLSDLSINNCAKLVIQYCAFAIIICLVTGCAAPKKVEVPLIPLESEDVIIPQKNAIINRPVEIRNSLNDNRPAWIHNPTFEHGNSVYFTGGFLRGCDYSVSIRAANAESLKNLVQAVGQNIRTEFSMFAKGSNGVAGGVDRYIQDGIAAFAKNVHIQGIRQEESYYEEMWDPLSQTTFYNAWVKLEIKKADYLRAKAMVVKRLRDDFHTAGEIEPQKKAQQLLDDLKGQVSESI